MESYLGESIPKLGFGLMRLPKDGDAIDIGQVAQMADEFLDAGFTYFDTSWGYPGSEEAFGKAVASRHPRESYVLATKCPVWIPADREVGRSMIDVSLERTGASYIDFYLLHNLGEGRTHYFEDFDMWNLVQEKKEQGLIRHWGLSFHDNAKALDELLTAHPETEFVQLQINYADWNNPAIESRKCYETARAHGKPVIVMEPVKGGSLTHLPDDVAKVFADANPDASLASWGVRYAASLEGVITVLSGMSSIDQMRDNISYMKAFEPLTDAERATIERARELLEGYRSIPCTACRYCAEVCEKNVAVSGIIEALNWYEMYHDLPLAQGRYGWNTDGHGLAKASACVKCGKCEEACPQHIKIRDELPKAVEIFGE